MGCVWRRARHTRHLDPEEERRIYNDLARRIQKCFEEQDSEKSKGRDRLSVKPLTNSMQE